MKIFEYGHYFVVFADGLQYEVDGNMGYKNAPWSKVQPNKVFIAKIDNGKVTAADIVDATQTFSGKILKCEKWDPELYRLVDHTILMNALKLVVEKQSLQPNKIIMHQDTYKDIKAWTQNEDI